MWDILVTYSSNHSRCNIFHVHHNHHLIIQLLRCWCESSFSLSERDGDSNRFQPAGNFFLTQTQADQINGHLRSPLVQLRHTFCGFDQLPGLAPHNLGQPAARMIRTTLPLGSRLALRTSLLPSRVRTLIEQGLA